MTTPLSIAPVARVEADHPELFEAIRTKDADLVRSVIDRDPALALRVLRDRQGHMKTQLMTTNHSIECVRNDTDARTEDPRAHSEALDILFKRKLGQTHFAGIVNGYAAYAQEAGATRRRKVEADAFRMRNAIVAHHTAVIASDQHPETYDVELWKTVGPCN